MRFRPALTTFVSLLYVGSMPAQLSICSGETVEFQLQEEYYGEPTWEFSTDGVSWVESTVQVGIPFIPVPGQFGWYRVRYHDTDCDTTYVSNTVRLANQQLELGASVAINVSGRVINEWGIPIFNAIVRMGCGQGVTTMTDASGVFMLRDVHAYEELAYLTVEKEGYFTGSRSFLPTSGTADAVHIVEVTLLQKAMVGSVNGAQGGQVNIEGVNITFPAGAFTRNEVPYPGEVRVLLNYIDPTADDAFQRMPGMLMGVTTEGSRVLSSFGMVAVELTDPSGTAVQLAPGSTAIAGFLIPGSQVSDAPQTIDMWYFDEALGYWMHDGQAVRVGDEYIAEISHFSWWNCDVPSAFVRLNMQVLDQSTGRPLAGFRVEVITLDMGTGSLLTNSEGRISGLVPVNRPLTISVRRNCGEGDPVFVLYEEALGPLTQETSINIHVSGSNSHVTGTLINCSGSPVEQGYVLAGPNLYFCDAGAFEFFVCGVDSVSLRGIDGSLMYFTGDLRIGTQNESTELGDLTCCTPLYDEVTDIDANVYATVIIGTQEWMAEDLRVTHYRDGGPIPMVVDNSEWQQLPLGSAAWSDYLNEPSYSTLHGHLYNWYAVTSPQGVCPQGWHVPSDAEWQVMEAFLGMPESELGLEFFRGSSMNIAGRMKADSPIWGPESWESDNLSGFTGLPGGFRDPNGTFGYHGELGHWWTSTSSLSNAWYRRLALGSGVGRLQGGRKSGYSVRCLKD